MTYEATGYIKDAKWEGTDEQAYGRTQTFAVGLTVAIPATDFTGLDLTQPITITQENNND